MKMSDFIIRFRWILIVFFILAAFCLSFLIPGTAIEPDIKAMLPAEFPSRRNTEVIDELFGGTEMTMIVLETDDVLQESTLKRVKNISKQINKIDDIDKVMSLFDLKNIHGENGAMIVEPSVRRIPKTAEAREKLREDIKKNDLVYGVVVSEDFTITTVIAITNTTVSDTKVLTLIQEIIDNNPGEEKLSVCGFPYTRQIITEYILIDLTIFLSIGLFIMLVFLFICFRQMRGVFLPFFVVVMAISLSLSVIPVLGWKITIATLLLPIILIAVANDYGIHMIARFQEINVPGNTYTPGELAKIIFQSLNKPVLLAGLTTMAGMLCLLGHIIISAQEVGILTTTGIFFALLASLFFIPAVISLLPKPKPLLGINKGDKKERILERLLTLLCSIVTRKPKLICLIFGIATCVLGTGIFFIVIDTDPNNFFSADSPVVRMNKIIDKKLGGSLSLSVVFRGDIKNPRIMKKIDSLEQHIRELPHVGNTTSIAQVVRMMSRAINEPGDEWYDVIPDDRNAIAQYFELYSISGDPDDFEKMVDFPYEHAILTIRLNTTSTTNITKTIRDVEQMIHNDPDVLLIGGYSLILSELAEKLVTGQLISLGIAIVAITILLMILFKSITGGFFTALPLLLSIIILFGFMGFAQINLNIITTMLSSIMIGVGIDYTIHFLWRLREEIRKGKNPGDAVTITLKTTGRGIIFNALSVIVGFSITLVSQFMIVQFFGFLIAVSIFVCLITALLLMPSLCMIFIPKFLRRK